MLCFCVGLTKDIRGSDWFWVFLSGTKLFAFLTWVFVFDKQSDSLVGAEVTKAVCCVVLLNN